MDVTPITVMQGYHRSQSGKRAMTKQEATQSQIYRYVVGTLMVASILFGFVQLMGWVKV
jgi:hypothetical protein